LSFDVKILNGDISIGQDGDFAIVVNSAKLVQDVIKFVTTDQGSSKFHPQIGSLISERLVGKVLTPENTTTVLQGSVQEAIVMLQKLQKQQAQSQILSPAETIVSIQDISVTRDKIDPRQLNVILKIQTADGNLLTETVAVRT